jgi:tRNA isopentenyl-2-thiomethyl-A-37 hydroxylase MiaE
VSSFDISSIHAFLPCATPDAWVEAALEAQDVLLIDHANCEKKAASAEPALPLHRRLRAAGQALAPGT